MTPTDAALSDALATPLIDHHCHGVSPKALDFTSFQALFSESYRPPPKGTTEFQKPLGLAIRRFCASLLDLEPSCPAETYVERRLALGAEEVNKRFLRGEIARRVSLKFAPDIRFRIDESFDEAERIDRLLRAPQVRRDLDDDSGGHE